jgi:hypothetical protein
MKLSIWAWAWALSGCLLTGDALAQGLRQPFSVRPTGFDYNRYLQDESPSPSDQPAQVVDAQPAQTPAAPAVGSGASPVYNAPCDVGACDSGCASCGGHGACGCGGGGGCALGGWLDCHCCLGEPYAIDSHLFCEDSPWNFGGWTQFGYHNHSDLLFNQHPGKFRLHQQWFYLEKVAQADACNWDWGFRGDIMYGVDAEDTQAFGNTIGPNGEPRGWDTGWDHGIYGFAIPQLYLEVARGDLSVKAGHFYTPIGYEVVPAPQNFFYSHSFTMYNSEPFTHTGVLATYSVSDGLDVFAGWTLGWDTAFDQFDDGSTFLGGVSATLTNATKLSYFSTIGDFGWRGAEGYMNSIVLDTDLTEKLKYIFWTDYLRVDSTGEDNFALNQYLIYRISDCLALGGRAEWWKTDPLDPTLGVGNISVYQTTFGINIRPHANLIFRPELRQQWSPAADYDETIFGVDMIATY